MAAFVPSKANPDATTAALEKTTADKSREAGAGFDGSWVAHPGLVPTCIDAFTAVLGDRPNQLERQRDDVHVSADQLTDVSTTSGEITMEGLRTNIRVSLTYLAAWIGGSGAVAIDNLMEDAATVEISRMQVWQWVRHQARTEDGTPVTSDLVESIMTEEFDRLAQGSKADRQRLLEGARDVFSVTCLTRHWPQFFTNYAYDHYLVNADV
jgi:malate synthase